MGRAQVFMDGLKRSLVAAAILGLMLGGCSAGSVFENLPQSMGGLPADAPAAPKVPYSYPAVHDMPPDRAAKTLDDNQQIKLEEDLEAIRSRQMRRAGENAAAEGDTTDTQAANPAAKPATKPAAGKKKPAAAKKLPGTAPQAGAATNP